jgi:hypothetical protein
MGNEQAALVAARDRIAHFWGGVAAGYDAGRVYSKSSSRPRERGCGR